VSNSNPLDMADATPPVVPVAPPDTARQVFPVSFEKDDLDFRGVVEEDEPVVPKASSVPVSASTQTSVTGLEDVSLEDLDKPVQTNVAKDKRKNPPPVSG
jgi:hypothetical protein